MHAQQMNEMRRKGRCYAGCSLYQKNLLTKNVVIWIVENLLKTLRLQLQALPF
jgi:hypothetical protein